MSPVTSASTMRSNDHTEFGAVKSRINTALDTLRNELKAIHEQDLTLLRQLMHIHHTINLLTGAKNRRSASSSCFSSSSIPEESPTRTERGHKCLSRGQSLPFRTEEREGEDDDEDESDDDDDEEEEEDSGDEADDLLSLSMNSNVSDPLGQSLNLPDHGEFSMFYPLPLNLQRPPLFVSQSASVDDDDDTSCETTATDDVTLPRPDDVTAEPANQIPNLVQMRSYGISSQPISTEEKSFLRSTSCLPQRF